MELPIVVKALIDAKHENDSAKYTNCFSESAVVHDEGKVHSGKTAIKLWNEKTSREYQMLWQPLAYEGTSDDGTLTTKVSGTFPGSPITMKFHFGISNGLIESLRMTD